MTTLKSIRFVNRDLLKYVALFLMVTGHLLIYTGIEHYSFIPSPLVQFFVYIRYGALVYALLFLSTQYLGWMVLRRLLRPSTLLYILSSLPALLLWWVACDVRWPMTVHVAVLMVLAVTAMLPARPVSRLAVSVVLLL